MKYLQYTRYLPLTLQAVGKSFVIWVASSHAFYADTRGYVGVYASMGKGAVMSSANRTKLNTPSSTETEIIGVREKLPKYIWF